MRWLGWLILLMACSDYEPRALQNPYPKDFPIPEGLSPEEITEVFYQYERARSDFLFVIDDSCSMKNEQVNLALNAPLFVDEIIKTNLDYHIGVITTDYTHEYGKLHSISTGWRYIAYQEGYDPVPEFVDLAMVGVVGGEEMGIASVYAAVKSGSEAWTYNQGFIRNDAALHIIVISDEDDHSEEIFVDLRSDLIFGLNNLKDEPGLVTFSSIVGISTCAEYGTDYLFVTDAIGGVKYNICEEDWASVLPSLAIQKPGLKKGFVLKYRPVEGSIVVLAEDEEEQITVEMFEEEHWFYHDTRNSIIFFETPPPKIRLEVTYVIER